MPGESRDHHRWAASSRRRARGTVAALAGTLLLVACGGGGSKISTTASVPSTQPAGPTPISAAGPTATVVKTNVAGYGVVLTDAKGFVLYTYTADNPGGTGCTGACLKLWPPLLLPAGVPLPIAGPGVSGLGTFARSEGTEVTYEGLPLYTYLSDTRPGQVSGQDLVDSGGTWILATIPAAPVPPSTATSTSPTTAEPAAVSPQATQPPVTKAPITSPPVTRAPVSSRPVTPPGVTSPHATAAPTTPRTSPATSPPPGVSY